jgi:hypothetical protein
MRVRLLMPPGLSLTGTMKRTSLESAAKPLSITLCSTVTSMLHTHTHTHTQTKHYAMVHVHIRQHTLAFGKQRAHGAAVSVQLTAGTTTSGYVDKAISFCIVA